MVEFKKQHLIYSIKKKKVTNVQNIADNRHQTELINLQMTVYRNIRI